MNQQSNNNYHKKDAHLSKLQDPLLQEGKEEVFLPGGMEAQMYRRQMQEGIPMAAEVVGELITLSRRLCVDIPIVGE